MAPRKQSVELTPEIIAGEMTPEQKAAAIEQWLNEKVPFFAFKDNERYKDDIVVWVNDEYCKIQRGKHVMIKRKFLLELESSARQKQYAAEVQDGFTSQFDAEVRPRMV